MRIVRGFTAVTLFFFCFCLCVDRAAGSPFYLAEEVQYRMIGVSGCPDPVANLLGIGAVVGASTVFILPELGVIAGGAAIRTQTATSSHVSIQRNSASWSILEAGIDLGWSIYFEGLSLVVNVGRFGTRPAGSAPSAFFAWYPGLGISILL